MGGGSPHYESDWLRIPVVVLEAITSLALPERRRGMVERSGLPHGAEQALATLGGNPSLEPMERHPHLQLLVRNP